MLRDLAPSRLVLFTGKGGVGKSTCAAAFALALSRGGQRVLLCETGARAVGPDYLDAEAVGHEPTRPRPDELPNLYLAHLDPRRALQEYLTEQLKAASLVRLATENRVLARLWNAMPSVNEMSLLNAIYQHSLRRREDGSPTYDTIVVDLPATGHALAMLKVPQGAMGMIRVGTMAQRARELNALLTDHAATAVCVVTIAEELPINESVELLDGLQRIGIRAEHLVVNSLLPEVFSGDTTLEAMNELLDQPLTDEVARALKVTRDAAERHRLQQDQVDALRERLGPEKISIQEVPQEPARGYRRIDAVAQRLADPTNP